MAENDFQRERRCSGELVCEECGDQWSTRFCPSCQGLAQKDELATLRARVQELEAWQREAMGLLERVEENVLFDSPEFLASVESLRERAR